MALLKSTSPVVFKADVSFTFGAQAAAACTDNTINNVLGVRPGWATTVWIEGFTANVGIVNAYCSALNTLIVRVVNPTAAGITPGAQTLRVIQR